MNTINNELLIIFAQRNWLLNSFLNIKINKNYNQFSLIFIFIVNLKSKYSNYYLLANKSMTKMNSFKAL